MGPTRDDIRSTMIEGDSGILACCPPWNGPVYRPSRLILRWKNGAIARGFSAEKPKRLRGPNLTDAWGDEWCAWEDPDAWKQLRFTLRKGRPRCLLTSTPIPSKDLKTYLDRAKKQPNVLTVIRGSTWDNRENLAEEFSEMLSELVGTRLGRQELEGEVLEDIEGALWTDALISKHRLPAGHQLPALKRVVIGVDPATKTKSDSDETGIVVDAIDFAGHGYCLGDYSAKYSPPDWARRVLDLAVDADAVVVETNRIGDMAAHTIRTALRSGERMPRILEVHTSQGKDVRAEPFVGLYEQGIFHHIGYQPKLEECMTTWVPGSTSGSPDPLDAHVHALAELYPNRPRDVRRGSGARPAGW